MQEVKKKKKSKSKRRLGKIITIILLAIVLILFGCIFYLNVIPILYTIILLVISLGITGLLMLANVNKIRGIRIIGYTLSVVVATIFVLIIFYLLNTLGFLFNITNGDYALNTYNVVVLKSSQYDELKDLDKTTMGISDTVSEDSLKNIKKKLSKIKLNYKNYSDSDALVSSIYENEVESIILENSEIDLLKENDLSKYDGLKIIYTLELKNDIEDIKEAVNINKEAFNIYISGIDTYGKINSVSRSDVNILVSVNPEKEKAMITWIPRDYYVNINNSSYKDKLTHAGIYGVESSIYAIEHLLDVEVNYYVKVNFTSVIKVVDELGGITVYNDETFTTNEGITFNKGNVTLNGERALAFVRDRKHVTGGDLGRGKNQIKVLEAIIAKAKSKEIIKNYNDILKVLKGSFVTNMSQNAMTGFISKELKKPRNWQIESQTLNGSDSYEKTYTYKNNNLYVMIPDNNLVNDAKAKIKEVLN